MTQALFHVCAALSLSAALLGFLALGDVGQWVVSFPRTFTYRVFRARFALASLALGGFAAVLFLGMPGRPVPGWALGLYAGFFTFLFFGGFVATTYVLFRAQQRSARYVPLAEVEGQLPADSEVLAIEINGDARAFPTVWLLQPHVAGAVVGGEPVVMTYCALSHLGMACKDRLEGRPLDLKVLTQLENNLVLFDSVTQEPIEQIYGRAVKRDVRLDQIPSTMMTLRVFRALHPDGLVFFNPPASFLDRRVRGLLERQLFSKGGHYDPANPRPVFPTIDHLDPRVPPKEQVYGVVRDGKAVAFTLGYLDRNGGAITELIGQSLITVKHFQEFGFVDVFEGEARDVDARGFLPGGIRQQRVPHASRVLWLIWANFHRHTDVRV